MDAQIRRIVEQVLYEQHCSVSVNTMPLACPHGTGVGMSSGNGQGNGSQAGLSTSTGNASATGSTVSLVSRVARDIEESKQIPRPLDTGLRVLRHVMTYFTTNTFPASTAQNPSPDPTQFNWMGVARLYLSPLNLGFERFEKMVEGAYGVDWIKIKVLSITFSKAVQSTSETTIRTIEDTETATKRYNTQQEVFVGLEGTTYTIGYLSADRLATTQIEETITPTESEEQNPLKSKPILNDMGDSFLHTNTWEDENGTQVITSEFYGVGFSTQHTKGEIATYQYDGPYASEMERTATHALSVSTEMIIEQPKVMALQLTETTQGKSVTTPQNTYAYTYKQGPFTSTQTLQFQSEQGKQTTEDNTQKAITGAITPIYGMVQIDLPEDLVQTVYHKATVCAPMAYTDADANIENQNGDPIFANKILETTIHDKMVLNANFAVLVEYGIRSGN